MSWHIFIRRLSNTLGDVGGISLAQWRAYVGSDDTLIAVPSSFGPGKTPTVHWIGPDCDSADLASRARLSWHNGSVRVACPADETIGKLWQIATALGGHIEDDDGDRYDQNGILIAWDEAVARYA